MPSRHDAQRGIIAENGRQTLRNLRVPADVWRLSRRPAFWSDTSLWFGKVLPLLPEPVPAPRVPAGTAGPTERPGSTKTGQLLGHGGVFHGGGGYPAGFFLEGWGFKAPRSPARYGLFACPACYSL